MERCTAADDIHRHRVPLRAESEVLFRRSLAVAATKYFQLPLRLPDPERLLTIRLGNANAHKSGLPHRCLAARARRLDATQFERLPAGHVPQDDCPEETNTLLLQWLEQL